MNKPDDKVKVINQVEDDNDLNIDIDDVLDQWEEDEDNDWEQEWDDDLKMLKELGF